MNEKAEIINSLIQFDCEEKKSDTILNKIFDYKISISNKNFHIWKFLYTHKSTSNTLYR